MEMNEPEIDPELGYWEHTNGWKFPLFYKWTPKEDITTFELAQCTKLIHLSNMLFLNHTTVSGNWLHRAYMELPPNAKRHWTAFAWKPV